jgi:hypothetical protein
MTGTAETAGNTAATKKEYQGRYLLDHSYPQTYGPSQIKQAILSLHPLVISVLGSEKVETKMKAASPLPATEEKSRSVEVVIFDGRWATLEASNVFMQKLQAPGPCLLVVLRFCNVHQ